MSGKQEVISLACSLPLVRLASRMKKAMRGEVLEVASDSFGFEDDIRRWCKTTGNEICGITHEGNITRITVKKV